MNTRLVRQKNSLRHCMYERERADQTGDDQLPKDDFFMAKGHTPYSDLVRGPHVDK